MAAPVDSRVAARLVDSSPLADISLKLARLESRFRRNVRDSVRTWRKLVDDEARLAGMTPEAKESARDAARAEGHGGFLLTLDLPSYRAVMRHAEDRALRRDLYEAHITRASDRGPGAGQFDNGPLVEEILALRYERARLLGFSSHAQAALRATMAGSADGAERFLLELNSRVRPQAEAELEAIWALAKSRDGLKGFRPWDLPYYAERLKEQELGWSEAELSEYFCARRVVASMLGLAEQRYGLALVPHPERIARDGPRATVRVLHGDGSELGVLELELYGAREERGEPEVAAAVPRLSEHSLQLPAVRVQCNFSPSVETRPCPMHPDEVRSLFHEFGGALYRLAAAAGGPVDCGDADVALESAELFGHLFASDLIDGVALSRIAQHFETGEPLPCTEPACLSACHPYPWALAMAGEIESALFDLRMHRDYVPAERSSRLRSQVLDTLVQARREVSLLPPPPWDRSASSFVDIFGSSRGGGHFLHLWAEAIAADRARDRDSLRAVSANGITALVRYLRDKNPSIDALLRRNTSLMSRS